MPQLTEILQLAQQIESDQELPLRQLRQRDHRLGEDCHAANDSDRLLYWLRAMEVQNRTSSEASRVAQFRMPDGSVLFAMRALAALLGALGMAGVLLASGRGLVNVFVFLAIFVVLQILLCLISAVLLLFAARGYTAPISPLNPLQWLLPRIGRVNVDKGAFLARVLSQFPTLLRLLLLRYGQELGALFTLGAITAFFVVLGFSDFTFVWGSTFNISDEFLSNTIQFMAMPWSGWIPAALPAPEVIEASRYHQAVTDLGQADIPSMRRWWPFLITAMAFYALLPRLVLWGLSCQLYRRQVRQAFVTYPGAKLVLARMQAPVVRTQASAVANLSADQAAQIGLDKGLVLIDWAAALSGLAASRFDGLAAVPSENIYPAGLDSPSVDDNCRHAVEKYRPEQLLIAVKSWEPPMLDLADFLQGFANRPPCTLVLIPLPEKQVNEHQLQEWRLFAQESSVHGLAVLPLRLISNTVNTPGDA